MDTALPPHVRLSHPRGGARGARRVAPGESRPDLTGSALGPRDGSRVRIAVGNVTSIFPVLRRNILYHG